MSLSPSLRPSHRVRWVTLGLCAAVLGVTSRAGAQTSPDELARQHFESGAAYLEQAAYEDALREFQNAYSLSQRPELLLNIATVQERMSQLDAALETLEAYVASAPEGEHIDTVRIRIENLRARAAAPPPDDGEVTPAAPVAAPPPAPPPDPDRPSPPATTPDARSRVPGWTFVGAGVAAGTGAAVTGLLAQQKYTHLEDTCGPKCTDPEVRPAKTLAWTSTALTGLAAVGVGVGAVLLLAGPQQPTRGAHSPRVTLAVSERGGWASATWRFR